MVQRGNSGYVCYLLAYREPRYIRTRTLLAALARYPHAQTVLAVNRSRGILRYFEMLLGLLILRIRKDPRVYILGFRGHEIFWPVRLLTWGRVLIFDAMMSPYGALREEGKHGWLGRWLAGWVKVVELGIFRWSDCVLTDTRRHRDWMMATFNVPLEKLVCVPVGADESLSLPAKVRADGVFRILFYGTFLPLHGVDVIFSAARLLRDRPVHFTIIGGRQSQMAWIGRVVAQCGGCVEHRLFVPFDDLLGDYIPKADLCLGGPFGDTPQASRVINGKTQQFLAMGKPTVIAHGDVSEGFLDRENVLIVPPADPESLAATILWAMDHPRELAAIAEAGRDLYRQRFSVERIGEIIHGVLARC